MFGLGLEELMILTIGLFLLWLYPYSLKKVILMTEETTNKWLWISLAVFLPIIGWAVVDKVFSQKRNNLL